MLSGRAGGENEGLHGDEAKCSLPDQRHLLPGGNRGKLLAAYACRCCSQSETGCFSWQPLLTEPPFGHAGGFEVMKIVGESREEEVEDLGQSGGKFVWGESLLRSASSSK